ncbi:unnamed protein product, partial [Adineta ricciae]
CTSGYFGRFCENEFHHRTIRRYVSESCGIIAIIILSAVIGFVVFMDILKYIFNIDPVQKYEEEFFDNELDSQVWNEIDSESNGELQEEYGIVEEVNPTSKNNTLYSIDCCRHFITDVIITLMVHETNRYTQQHLPAQELI